MILRSTLAQETILVRTCKQTILMVRICPVYCDRRFLPNVGMGSPRTTAPTKTTVEAAQTVSEEDSLARRRWSLSLGMRR